MTDNDNWRNKYRALALESEQNEKHLSDSLDQMRSLVMQLDLAVHGQRPQLDALLTQLTSQLQQGKFDHVTNLLQKTEQQIRQLDQSRSQQAQAIVSRIDEWASLLQKGASANQSTTLSDVKQQLTEAEDTTHQLPGLIDQLLSVQRHHLQPGQALEAGDDLAVQEGIISSRLAVRLLELIELLNVPSQHMARAHSLIQQLEAGPSAAELEVCLKEIAELARICGGSAEVDIQKYLVGLNQQLEYLRSFLDKAEDSDTVQRQRNNLLDQTVRQDVRKISHTVKNTSDINELKQAVNTQLASLIKAVNNHKVAEDKHHTALKQDRAALLARLDEMELKAEQFRKSAEEAHMRSKTDPLTGLANRFGFDQQLENELERFERYATPFSLCVADIDFFKRVNDDFGHLAGDKCLRLVAKILRSNLRGVDFVARIGGEEFVILMPSTHAEAARQAAENVRMALEQSPFNFQSRPIQITISIGVAEVKAKDTADTLFGRADRCLYDAKNNGRNRVHLA